MRRDIAPANSKDRPDARPDAVTP